MERGPYDDHFQVSDILLVGWVFPSEVKMLDQTLASEQAWPPARPTMFRSKTPFDIGVLGTYSKPRYSRCAQPTLPS